METQAEIYININSDNGLLPDGTKSLFKKMPTYHRRSFVACYVLRYVLYDSRYLSVLNVYHMHDGSQCVGN